MMRMVKAKRLNVKKLRLVFCFVSPFEEKNRTSFLFCGLETLAFLRDDNKDDCLAIEL